MRGNMAVALLVMIMPVIAGCNSLSDAALARERETNHEAKIADLRQELGINDLESKVDSILAARSGPVDSAAAFLPQPAFTNTASDLDTVVVRYADPSGRVCEWRELRGRAGDWKPHKDRGTYAVKEGSAVTQVLFEVKIDRWITTDIHPYRHR